MSAHPYEVGCACTSCMRRTVEKYGDRPPAGPPVMDFDAIYPIHDGLEPEELDIEVEFEDYEWRDRWTVEDKRGVLLIVALIVLAIVCYRLGELSAMGWFS